MCWRLLMLMAANALLPSHRLRLLPWLLRLLLLPLLRSISALSLASVCMCHTLKPHSLGALHFMGRHATWPQCRHVPQGARPLAGWGALRLAAIL